jgi:hypothetical protein
MATADDEHIASAQGMPFTSPFKGGFRHTVSAEVHLNDRHINIRVHVPDHDPCTIGCLSAWGIVHHNGIGRLSRTGISQVHATAQVKTKATDDNPDKLRYQQGAEKISSYSICFIVFT